MRKIILLLCVIGLLAFTSTAIAAGAKKMTPPTTEMEKFLTKTGDLFIKDFISVDSMDGRYGSFTINAIIIETARDSKKQKGLRIEAKSSGSYEREESVFIDIDEIPSLIKGVKSIIKLQPSLNGSKNYREIVFNTKGHFTVGTYYNHNNALTASFITCGNIGAVNVFLKGGQLTQLKTALEKGLQILNARK